MLKCENCVNAIFDPHMGEYKCKVRQHIIYEAIHCARCTDFKEKKGNKK